MQKSVLFEKLLNIVSEETEVERDVILSGDMRREVVDARYILVYLLYRNGFYPLEIAERIGRVRRSVSGMISSFDSRRDTGKMLRDNLERIEKRVGN